jgi:flagellar export protein FliJ
MAQQSGLETLRKLRQSEERQQELLLQEVNQRIGNLRHKISDLEAELTHRKEQQLRKLAGLVPASELQFDELCHSALLAYGRALKMKLAAEVEQRDLQMQNLLRARQARETVETLVHHKQEARRSEQLRREQQSVDEMFLLRTAYLAR